MADTTALRTLKAITKKAIWQSGKDMSHYKKFHEYIIEGFRDLRIYHVNDGMTLKKMSVDQDLFTVDFPDDLVKFIDVGIARLGKVWSLTYEDKVLTTTTTSGSESYDTDIGEGADLNKDIYSGYRVRGGVNDKGYYTIDHANRRLMLRDFIGTQVWVYYVSSGVSLSAGTYVPVLYEKYLVSYALYNNEVHDANGNNNLIARYKAMMDENLVYLRRSQRASLQRIYDAFNSVTYPLIKR